MNSYPSLLQPMQLPPLLGGSTDVGQMPPVAAPIPSRQPPIAGPQAAQLPPQEPLLGSTIQMPAPLHPHQNLLGRVHDALMNSILGPVPGGYSPEELQAQRPGLADVLMNPNTSKDYEARLADARQRTQGNAQIARQQQILAARDAFAKQFPPPTSGSPAEMEAWVNRAIPFFTAHGDTETVKDLIPLAQKFVEQKTAKGNKFQAVQAGDQVFTFDPEKGTFSKGVDRGVNQDEKDIKAQERALRELALKQGYQEFQIKGAEGAARAFASANKTLTDASNTYTAAKASIAEARKGNPAAMSSAIVNFVASADAKMGVLRQGTLNFMKQMDKSFAGNLRASITRILSGTLPPEQLDMMEQLIDHIHADQVAAYEHRRTGVVGRNPLTESYIPPTEEVFGTAPQAPTAAPTGANRVRNLIGKP